MLSVWTWMHVLAATSSVVVVALALSKHSNVSFRVPLVALAVDQFIWNGASVAGELTKDPTYKWAGAVVTPVFTALILHYALAFTGRLRTFGDHLSLAVTDTGEGMDPRTKEQAFSLFFTTKAQGSGLGLAFVKQIARAHGGEVRLESREGHGTRVELLFPLTAR